MIGISKNITRILFKQQIAFLIITYVYLCSDAHDIMFVSNKETTKIWSEDAQMWETKSVF